MALQKSVPSGLGLGLPGQKYDSGPYRATSYTLASLAGRENRTGYVFTFAGEGKAGVGGNSQVLGILGAPHVYAAPSLEAGMIIPNGQAGEIASLGRLIVVTEADATPGDQVVYNTTTGAISSVLPGAAVPEGYALLPGATFVLFTAAAGGLAVVDLK